MRAKRLLLGIGEYLVGRACQRLPRDIRQERYREWAAELPVILQDRQIGAAPRHALRMLAYAADTLRGAARTPVKGRRRQPLLTAVFCLLLVAGLAVAGWDIKAITGASGDPLNYPRLAWAVLLIAYPVAMLRRSALRPPMLIVSAGSLMGAAVSLWDAARAPADWANYFSAALLVLLTMAMWIVIRRAHARRALQQGVRICPRATDSRNGRCPTCTGRWIMAVVDRRPSGGSDDPHAVPDVYRGTAGRPGAVLFTLDVDDERFAIRQGGEGGTNYDWLTGPNSGYGFTSSGAPNRSVEEHLEAIRVFLAMIDSNTGYIGDD